MTANGRRRRTVTRYGVFERDGQTGWSVSVALLEDTLRPPAVSVQVNAPDGDRRTRIMLFSRAELEAVRDATTDALAQLDRQGET